MKNKKNLVIVAIISVVILVVLLQKDKINYPSVGVVLPLSGPASFVGEDFRRGMEFASEEFDVDLSFQDGKAAPTDSLNAAVQLQNSGSRVILSAFRGASLSIASFFKDKDNVTIFSTTATSDRAPIGDFGKNFFAVGAEMISNGSEAGKHAKNICTSVAVLTEQTDAGLDKVKGFSDAIGQNKVVYSEVFPTDRAEFRDLITKIKQYSPDCIFVEIKSNYFNGFMDQLVNLNLSPKIYTTSYSVNKDVSKKLSDKQKELIIFSSSSIYPQESFSKKYFEKFNRYPNDFALIGYEMIKLIAENQNGCNIENYVQCLNNNLAKIKNISSSLGELNIDQYQEIKLRNNTLYKVVGEEFVEL